MKNINLNISGIIETETGTAQMSGILNLMVSTAITSTFSPTDIAGLKLWFDASDSGTITQSGGAVSQWNDKSGNANNATQSVIAQRPTIHTAAQNGLDTILFTPANNEYFDLTSSVNVDSAFTGFAVIERLSQTGLKFIMVFSSSSGTTYSLAWDYTDAVAVSNSSDYVTFTPYAATGFHSITTDMTGSVGHIWIDGVAETTSSNAFGRVPGFNAIGNYSGTFANGEMGEILLYDSILSSTDRGKVEAYLKAKWATP